ncbi:MAG: tRNA-specific adenosine deaminase [Flavobacteriales bacterium]|nr:tRNA-specific adenosine deaminase [Flavobacteriales bacterium]|tara:strand:+ start:16147 stop:16593 length:447 start_codon:yes stop_codon:yes gene_type:complete
MELNPFTDTYFMKEAIKEARKALDLDEVPVGCVIVCENNIISRTHNYTQKLNDVTAHAEVLAITAAADYLGSKYLSDCIMYVTLEPCIMCAGAAYWAQFKKIVFGAKDLKRGYSSVSKNILHPKTKVVGNVLNEECTKLLRDFFKKKR